MKPPEAKAFQERLCWLRSQTGFTQEEFGRRTGVSKGYISRLESGKRTNPSEIFLRHCRMAFGLPTDWLESGAGGLPVLDPGVYRAEAISPPFTNSPAAAPETQQDLIGFMRLLLEAVPMTSDVLVRLTGVVWECPELSAGFRERLVLAANVALSEQEQRRQAAPKT